MGRLNRRKFIKGAATLVGASTLAACQPKVVEKIVKETVQVPVEKIVKETVVVTEKEEVTKVVEKEKVVEKVVTVMPQPVELEGEITIQFWGDVQGYERNPLQNQTWGATYLMIKDWAARHPKVKVNWYSVPAGEDVYDITRTALISGTAPDLIAIYAVTKFVEGNMDLLYDFAPDLELPNPYGTMSRWKDEFFIDPNAFSLADQNGGIIPRDKVYFIGNSTSSNYGQVVCYYNKDAFDALNINGRISTWKEMVDACDKLQKNGWQSPMFAANWMVSHWFVVWNWEQIGNPIIQEVIDTWKKDIPGWDDEMQAWAIKTGVWRADDPRTLEVARIVHDLLPYCNKDWAAPESVNYWLTKRCAILPDGFWSIRNYRESEERDFQFGTFCFPPKITAETSQYATDAEVRRHGGTEGGEISNSWAVPLTTLQKGNMPIVKDLLQYLTARPSNDFWCTLQYPPCIPKGKKMEDVIKDPVEQEQLYGFFYPTMDKAHGIRSVHPAGPSMDTYTRLTQQYYRDEIGLEQLGKELQAEWERVVEKQIIDRGWDPAKWPARKS